MTQRKTDRRYKNTITRTRRHLEKNPHLAVCWLCGQPINMQLPPHHEMAFTLDHIIPLARGGKLHDQTKPAHRKCNSARGKSHNKTNTTHLNWTEGGGTLPKQAPRPTSR